MGNLKNWLGRAVVAIILFLLIVAAIRFTPELVDVMAPILLGIAAIITSINGGRSSTPPTGDADTNSSETGSSDDTQSTAPDDGQGEDATGETET